MNSRLCRYVIVVVSFRRHCRGRRRATCERVVRRKVILEQYHDSGV